MQKMFSTMLTAVTTLVLLVPNFASADVKISGFLKNDIERKIQLEVCTDLTSKIISLEKKLIEKKKEVEDHEKEEGERLKEKRREVVRATEVKKVQKTEPWLQTIAQFEAQLADPEQKRAVQNFKAAVSAAIAARQAAIDDAIVTFKEKTDAAISAHKAALAAAIRGRTDAIVSATVEAKSNCLSVSASDSVKKSLEERVKKANEKFKEDRKELDSYKEAAEDAREERKQAIEEAQEVFKQAIEKARAELKAALR